MQAVYLELPWSSSFQHFTVDEIPRLAPILWMLRQDAELKIIVQKSDVVSHILQAFGIDVTDRLIPYRMGSVFCANELLYPHGWPNAYSMGYRSAELVYYAHRQLFPSDTPVKQRSKIIYTSRAGNRGRSALNEEQVIETIKQWMKRNNRQEELHIWGDSAHSVCAQSKQARENERERERSLAG